MLSGRNQTKKNTYYLNPYVYNPRKCKGRYTDRKQMSSFLDMSHGRKVGKRQK